MYTYIHIVYIIYIYDMKLHDKFQSNEQHIQTMRNWSGFILHHFDPQPYGDGSSFLCDHWLIEDTQNKSCLKHIQFQTNYLCSPICWLLSNYGFSWVMLGMLVGIPVACILFSVGEQLYKVIIYVQPTAINQQLYIILWQLYYGNSTVRTAITRQLVGFGTYDHQAHFCIVTTFGIILQELTIQLNVNKLKTHGRLRMVQIPMFDVDDYLKYKTRLYFRYLQMGHGVT